jgi:hypothetical protein
MCEEKAGTHFSLRSCHLSYEIVIVRRAVALRGTVRGAYGGTIVGGASAVLAP